MNKQETRNLIKEIQKRQQEIVGRKIIAPMISGSRIIIKIAGLIHFLDVADNFYEQNFTVGLFQVETIHKVSLIRSCTMQEQNEYLSLFPRIHVVVVDPENNIGIIWGNHIKYVKFVSTEKRNIFDIISCRIIGNMPMDCGFSMVNDPQISATMRRYLIEKKNKLPIAWGISGFHRIIYSHIFERNKETKVDVVKNALEYNKAGLVDYREMGDNIFRVRYIVDGREFVSDVSIDNLQVLSSGVCLSGQDSMFDLTSVVGVLRRGIETDQI